MILLTGHKGFIGTNLIHYLNRDKINFFCIDYPDNLLLRTPTPLPITAVIHLASETNVRKSILDPSTFVKNCQSTFSALEYARLSKAHFIFTSSCGANEPSNPYSASKLACEALCKAHEMSYNLPVTILRLSNVYGPHSIHKDSVIPKFIKSKLKSRPITINGTGHQTRDFIHVSDVCKAILESKRGTHQISTGQLTSINTLAEMLEIHDINFSEKVDGEVFHPLTDKWEGCEVEFKQGLESTFNWFKEIIQVN